ncbi:hypothetical protein CC79DRAFT_686698 [Sarocladium strictum]
MPSMRTYATAAAVLLGSIASADYFNDEGQQVSGEQLELWGSRFTHPNVSGKATFPGWDVSRRYSNDTSDLRRQNWTAYLNITTDVLFADVWPHGDPDDKPEGYVLGAKIGIQFDDEEGSKEVDDSWGLCIAASQIIPVRNTTVNSNCEGTLSDSCLAYFKNLTESGILCRNKTELHDKYEDSYYNTSACDDDFMFLPPDFYDHFFANETDFTSGGVAQAVRTGSFDTAGSSQYCDTYATEAWLMIVGFAPRSGMSDEGYVDIDTELPSGSMVCLRADEVAEGSRTYEQIKEGPTKDQDDAAVALGGHWQLALVSAVGAVALASLL